MKSSEWKRKTGLENIHAKFSSVFGCDRPGSGGNVAIPLCEIAFKNNEGMPETFAANWIVTGQNKIAENSFEVCEKKEKTTVSS